MWTWTLKFVDSHTIPATIIATLIAILSLIVCKIYTVRSRVRNLPSPPGHSFLWGHAGVISELYKTVPKRVAVQALLLSVKEIFDLGDAFYVDLWPFGYSILVVVDPALFTQVSIRPSLPKHRSVGEFLSPLVEPTQSIVSQEGHDWKTWRAAFNPGFSPSQVQTFVPAIVEEVQVFAKLLEDRAKKHTLFRMERLTTKLTLDIIGRVVMDERFQCQTTQNPVIEAFEQLVKILSSSGPLGFLKVLDIKRTWSIWRCRRTLDSHIGETLEHRFATRQNQAKGKLVIDLAMDHYLQQQTMSAKTEDMRLDPTFKNNMITQIKAFLFAGHDTTSSTVCYAYYHLSKSSESLQKIRSELDEVLGCNRSESASRIIEDPSILGRLVYTTAVLKETLRLCPPASSLREGQKGFSLHKTDTGEYFPTEGFLIWPISVGIHRHEATWGSDAGAFRPARFLSSESSSTRLKDGFIPFSRGPRNCIGQDLALTEAKIILALTVREFDFAAGFKELDQLQNDGTGYPCDMSGPQSQFDDEAYQIQLGAAKPREGMPCRVALRA